MTRIAVGGFLHETNTFAPTKATYDAFVHGGGWPRMETGAGILKALRRINVGLAGFIEAAEAERWDLVAWGSELGTAREVVSRTLSEFQRRGWIGQARGEVHLIDRAGLERLVRSAG